MFVWCRAYGCRSVSVGLIFPLFLSAGALVPLYLVLMDPSKDWLPVPLCFHTSCMISVVKWVPRSELTLKGSPNLEKMWFINRQAFVSSVSPGAGRHSIHFVNSLSTVRKYLLPRVDRGTGPTQSIWRSDDGKVILFLCSGARRFGFACCNWQHTRLPLTYSASSCCMPGQYATCLSIS